MSQAVGRESLSGVDVLKDGGHDAQIDDHRQDAPCCVAAPVDAEPLS